MSRSALGVTETLRLRPGDPETSGIESYQTRTMPLSVASIHDIVRQEIIFLHLRPGTRVSENKLARRFGTSRTPVREAVFRLVDEGLMEVWPQRGTFVTRISLQAVRRARFVREALEVAILHRAAVRGLSEASLEALDKAICDQEVAQGDPERFTVADDAFHRALSESVEVGNIWAVLEREKGQFDRLRFLSLPDVTPVSTLIEQHKAMLLAIRARDVVAAEHAAREHLSEVLKVADTLAAKHPELIVNDT